MAKKPMLKLGALAAVGAVALGTFIAAAPSQAASSSTPPPVKAGSPYLALGDSIAFGYIESNAVLFPSTGYSDASQFVGYPEIVAKDLKLKLTNAACPGETSSSFAQVGHLDNGCTHDAFGGPGYRAAGFPLHAKYGQNNPTESQLTYAVHFLKAHPGTKLVTLQIGANDGLRCIAHHNCNPQTGEGFTQIGQRIYRNVTKILKTLTKTAGYQGQIVLVNYYAINSAVPAYRQESITINNIFANAIAPKFKNVTVANVYNVWAKQSRYAPGNDTCKAGLENVLTAQGATNGWCGIHPSVSGSAWISRAVEKVITTG